MEQEIFHFGIFLSSFQKKKCSTLLLNDLWVRFFSLDIKKQPFVVLIFTLNISEVNNNELFRTFAVYNTRVHGDNASF